MGPAYPPREDRGTIQMQPYNASTFGKSRKESLVEQMARRKNTFSRGKHGSSVMKKPTCSQACKFVVG